METSAEGSRLRLMGVAVAFLGAVILTVAVLYPVSAASCIVTSTADSGAGTLRQCMLGAGPGDVITFDPTVFPPGAPATINLTAPLPVMAAGGVTIDAANAGVKVDGDGIGQENADGIVLASSDNALYGLHLHAFHGRGIVVQSGANDNQIGGALPGQRNIVDRSGNGAIYILGNGNQVSGNWIGTEDGVTLPGPAGNAGSGVELAAGAQRNIIGGDQPGQGNVIVGSQGNGVGIYGSSTTSNTVSGNWIGLGADGLTELGNQGSGVHLADGASFNLIGGANTAPGAGCAGACNVISGNGDNGVAISNPATAGNILSGNLVGTNAGGTLARGNVGNGVFLNDGAHHNRIGGNGAEGNVIAASQTNQGIHMMGVFSNTVVGNYIGLDGTGMNALGNYYDGVNINEGSQYNRVGGSSPAERNYISGNFASGVDIDGPDTAFNTVAGNWIGLDVNGTQEVRAQVVVLSPNYAADQTLWVSALDSGIWQSTDGGYIWAQVNSGLTRLDVPALAISPAYVADGTLFAGTADGAIYKTTNGGGSWTEVYGGGLDGINVLAVSPNYAVDGMVFAGAEGGLLRSTDRGATWIGQPGALIYDLAPSPAFGADHTVFTSGSQGKVFRSNDSGVTWTDVTGAWNYEQANALAVSPAYAVDHTLFVGTTYGDPCSSLFKSLDGGDSWALIPRAGWCKIGAVAVAPNYPANPTLLVGAESGLRLSRDDGANWDLVWNPGQFLSFAFSPAFAVDDVVYATRWTLGLLKSTDGGANWTVLTGLTQQGNQVDGVQIRGGAHDNTIGGANASPGSGCTGACNVISKNGNNGVSVADAETHANVVSGNYIGTDGAGLLPLGNGEIGVSIGNGAYANQVGGNSPGERNLLSGNGNLGVEFADPGTRDNVAIGNYVGADATGLAALPNHGGSAVRVRDYAHNNRIGGLLAGEGNLISGNDGSGIGISGGVTNTLVAGNLIGTDATGLTPLGNGREGIYIQSDASHNTIGGVTAEARNVIGANDSGVSVGTPFNTVSGNYIGVAANGTLLLGNHTNGVSLYGGAHDNIIGGAGAGGNVISGNGDNGVILQGPNTTSNTVLGNRIGPDADGARDLRPLALALAPGFGTTSNTLWVGAQDHGVWRSTDGGATWAAVNTGLTNQQVRALVVANDGALFAGTTGGGIFRSTDGGDAWVQVGAGATESNILALAASPTYGADGTLFAGTWDGILVSTDRGANWAPHNELGASIYDIAVAPTAPLTVFAGGDGGRIFKSTDGGQNWVDITGGWDFGRVSAVALSPNYTGDQTVFAGTMWGDQCGMLFKSTNGGQQWQAVNHGGWCEILDVALSPAYPADKNIFVGAQWSGVHGSPNDGAFWSSLLQRQRIGALALSPAFATDPVVFAASLADGVFKSVDGGLHWAPLGGLTQPGNGRYGVEITDGAHDNTIGGATAGAGNWISNNGDAGIAIRDPGTDANLVYGNRIGTNAVGTAALGNGNDGVRVDNGAQRNSIGGGAAGQGNLISGNVNYGVGLYGNGTMHNVVAGNRIGVNAAGNGVLGNGEVGVELWEGPALNVIGGVKGAGEAGCTGVCNLIGGNPASGVRIRGAATQSNTVSGNYIGVDLAGSAPLPNGNGVELGAGAAFNRIGGENPAPGGACRGACNLLSGNVNAGVFILDPGTTRNTVSGNFVGVTATGAQALPNVMGIELLDGASFNQVGGDNATPGAACSGACNVIGGNSAAGVWISESGANSNTVAGNYIGADAAGAAPVGNARGVRIQNGASHNLIGGVTPARRNVIGGNGYGIGIFFDGTEQNTVSGNYIGVGADGSSSLGNESMGVYIAFGASHNLVGGTLTGQANVIARNVMTGVVVEGTTALGNALHQNSIFANALAAIELVDGGNAELPAPLIVTVTNGSNVVGTACANCTIEVFSDAADEGRVFEGSTVANGAGQFTFQAPGFLTGPRVTATATDASGNTSEFSQPLVLPTQALRVYLPVVEK